MTKKQNDYTLFPVISNMVYCLISMVKLFAEVYTCR